MAINVPTRKLMAPQTKFIENALEMRTPGLELTSRFENAWEYKITQEQTPSNKPQSDKNQIIH